MIEQRKHQRFELRLPFEVIRNGSPLTVRGETKNVSSAGVLFTAEGQLPLGESIEYLITLPRTPGTRKDVRLRCVERSSARNTDPLSRPPWSATSFCANPPKLLILVSSNVFPFALR